LWIDNILILDTGTERMGIRSTVRKVGTTYFFVLGLYN